MFIEIFRMLFGGKHAERGRGTWWWFVAFSGVVLLLLGLWAASGAFVGEYPWHQERVFLAVVLLWAALLTLRTKWDWKPEMPAPIAFVVRWFNHLLTLALLYVPGLAVLWYSLEATNSPSLNSRGNDVCNTSSAQYCVSGPRALIPWAIILLVFAFVATWFFIWKWSTNGGRTSRVVKPVYDIADSVRRVEAVIPPNDPGAAAFHTQATEASEAVSELMGTMLRRGSISSLVQTLSKIGPTTVIDLRQDGTAAQPAATTAAPATTTTSPAEAAAEVFESSPPDPQPVSSEPVTADASPASAAPAEATPQEWPPRRPTGRELNAFANIPRPDSPAPGQPRREGKMDTSPVEAGEPVPTDPNEAVHALGELVQMHRAGEITDAEFDTMKARLIGGRPDAG